MARPEIVFQENKRDDTVTILVDGKVWDRVFAWKDIDWQGLLRAAGCVVRKEDVTPTTRKRATVLPPPAPVVLPTKGAKQGVTNGAVKQSTKRAAKKV